MIDDLRSLSVQQPWASLIASGRKPVELRSWTTNYRGPVLITVGKRAWKGEHDWPVDGPRGVTLCLVDLVDVRPATAADAELACIEPPAGYFAWVFANPRPVVQVRTRGKLGLCRVPATLRAAIGVAA